MNPSFSTIIVLTFSCVLLLTESLRANPPTTLPSHQALIDGDLNALQHVGNFTDNASAEIVEVDGPDGANVQAIRVDVRERQPNDYSLQLRRAVSVGLAQGEVVWMSAHVRTVRTLDESGQGWLGFVLEQSKAPFTKLIQRRISVGDKWLQVCVPARVKKDVPAGEISISLRVGGAAQTLEITQLRLVRFDDSNIDLSTLPQTRITYAGREPDAPWRAEAAARIEQIRKAPLTVRVVDSAGNPLAGAQVSVVQRKHAFPFGSVYNVTQIVGDRAQTPNGQMYQKVFAELFNVGVDEYAMKWPHLERPGTRERAMEAIEWMNQHGIAVRGHCLIWPSWRQTPGNLKELQDDPTALRQRIADHITATAGAFRGKVFEWDVINEPYVHNDLMKILGYETMAEWFKLARAADPEARLFLNETSAPTSPLGDVHYDVLYEHARLIQQHGGPLGGIGMQAHFGSQLTSPPDLQKIYDRFATLGVPLQITELDIDVADEEVQADYMRDFLTITFAHPNTSGIILWGFWSEQHWRPQAALFAKDWTLRPVGRAWVDLVHGQWKTQLTAATDPAGTLTVRGFLGEYEIIATLDGKQASAKVTLDRPGAEVTVRLP